MSASCYLVYHRYQQVNSVSLFQYKMSLKRVSISNADKPEKLGQLVYDWDMRLIMNDEQLQTIEQVKQFLEGSKALEFRVLSVGEKYNWIKIIASG